MSANGVDGLLRAAKEQAQMQAQAEQMLNMTLKTALHNPHSTKRHKVHLAAVALDGNDRVLMFGLPTGERLEIEMTPSTATQVANGLLSVGNEDEADEREAA